MIDVEKRCRPVVCTSKNGTLIIMLLQCMYLQCMNGHKSVLCTCWNYWAYGMYCTVCSTVRDTTSFSVVQCNALQYVIWKILYILKNWEKNFCPHCNPLFFRSGKSRCWKSLLKLLLLSQNCGKTCSLFSFSSKLDLLVSL